MSKRFKSQDYFRYKRLGARWRRPVGLQSKLRIKKGGSGKKVSIGYGTRRQDKNKIAGTDVILVQNANQLLSTDNAAGILIGSGVSAKSTLLIAQKAKELNIRILNMKKVKRSEKILKTIQAKQQKKKQKKEEKKEAKEIMQKPKEDLKEKQKEVHEIKEDE